MGTNFYRIPTVEEMEMRREKLLDRVKRLKFSGEEVENGFTREYGTDSAGFFSFDRFSPWDEFVENTRVHLGKRSGGWTFSWNHNNWVYYQDKETLIRYINEGRVVNEYGEDLATEEFIEMALNWCPDGFTNEKYLKEELIAKGKKPLYPEHYIDIYRDGLRFINTTEFS
jgi:hypothetical protein